MSLRRFRSSKSAEFLASQLIHRVENVSTGDKIGYQNNRVVSDLNYSDYLSDVEKRLNSYLQR